MESLLEGIVQTYNSGIKTCAADGEYEDYGSKIAVCGIEKLLEHSIANRLTRRPSSRKNTEPFSKTMCGCRLTASVVFAMVELGLTVPAGSRFLELYRSLFLNDRSSITSRVLRGSVGPKMMDRIWENELPGITTYLPMHFDNTIVCIGHIGGDDTPGMYVPLHTFLVVKTDTGGTIVSSWYAGGDQDAFPLRLVSMSAEALRGILVPYELRSPETIMQLFGVDKKLPSDLRLTFISREALYTYAGLDPVGRLHAFTADGRTRKRHKSQTGGRRKVKGRKRRRTRIKKKQARC